jgi:hypothetical protein
VTTEMGMVLDIYLLQKLKLKGGNKNEKMEE